MPLCFTQLVVLRVVSLATLMRPAGAQRPNSCTIHLIARHGCPLQKVLCQALCGRTLATSHSLIDDCHSLNGCTTLVICFGWCYCRLSCPAQHRCNNNGCLQRAPSGPALLCRRLRHYRGVVDRCGMNLLMPRKDAASNRLLAVSSC
jgi:hypothetical protein